MGFKKISKEELESSKAPAFIGAPIKYTEKVDLLESEKFKAEKGFEQKESNVFLTAQENLKYEYSKNGQLENFEGLGNISVINNSMKNRIWDVNLSYSNIENISEHQNSINNKNKTNLGNFEPQNNKNLNYKIKNSDDIVNPIKIFEKISVSNLNKDNLGTKIKKQKIQKLEKEIEEKKNEIKEQLEDKYGSQISSLESELKEIKKEKKDILKKLSTQSDEKEGINKDINALKSLINDLVSEKKQSKRENLGDFLNDDELDKDLEKLLQESKQNLEAYKSQIQELKGEEPERKEQIQQEVFNEFNPRIQQLEKDLKEKKEDSEKVSKKRDDWSENKDSLDDEVERLKDDLKSSDDKLKKKKIEKELEKKKGEFEEAEEKVDTLSDELKSLKKTIKNINKEIESLKDEKEDELEDRIEEYLDKKEENIEKYEDKVEITEELIEEIKEIIEEYNEDIEKYRKKLDDRMEDLNKAKGKSDELIETKEELQVEINTLQEKIQNLKETKEDRLENEFEKIQEQKKKRKQRILDGYDDMIGEKIRDNYYLLLNKENKLNFSINIINNSENLVEDVKLAKQFTNEFSDFKYESGSVSDVEIKEQTLVFSINSLEPGEKAEIEIYTNITPVQRKIIGTGNIHLSYIYKDRLISNLQIEGLKGYSHAMHAIKIKEKETEPNTWVCNLIFKNNSDINMKLKSLLVLDKEKEQKFLDLNFDSEDSEKILKPQERYVSEKWEVEDKQEPKFYRKLNYSITHKKDKKTLMNLKLEESTFEIIDLSIDKKFSESKIKSYEESNLDCVITVKNIGTVPTKGILIKETIPEDFLPSTDLSDMKITTSSGKDISEKVKTKIVPDNHDPSESHEIQIKVNLESIKPLELIKVSEFLKISYPFKAIQPDYKKNYQFPIEVTSYYPKEKKNPEDFYYITRVLDDEELPKLNVIHQRRNLLIAKEIFPGRDVDEFAVSLIINNSSNIEINDIHIDDTLPKSIEIVSSNKEYDISESDLEDARNISFTIESILPYQEEEIRYYVRNKDDEALDQEKLESYLLT